MIALAKPERIMYNITRARRPTDRRPEADAGGRTPRRLPDACTQGTREARGYRVVGGAAEVRGRVGLDVLPPCVRAPRTASHERGARELRSGLRGVWTQAQAPQAASAVNFTHAWAAEKTKDEDNKSAFTICLRNRIRPNSAAGLARLN